MHGKASIQQPGRPQKRQCGPAGRDADRIMAANNNESAFIAAVMAFPHPDADANVAGGKL